MNISHLVWKPKHYTNDYTANADDAWVWWITECVQLANRTAVGRMNHDLLSTFHISSADRMLDHGHWNFSNWFTIHLYDMRYYAASYAKWKYQLLLLLQLLCISILFFHRNKLFFGDDWMKQWLRKYYYSERCRHTTCMKWMTIFCERLKVRWR